VDPCTWAYGTIYGQQSTDLSQSIQLAGFAGTVHTKDIIIESTLESLHGRATLREK
jgi:hypothetical protein